MYLVFSETLLAKFCINFLGTRRVEGWVWRALSAGTDRGLGGAINVLICSEHCVCFIWGGGRARGTILIRRAASRQPKV